MGRINGKISFATMLSEDEIERLAEKDAFSFLGEDYEINSTDEVDDNTTKVVIDFYELETEVDTDLSKCYFSRDYFSSSMGCWYPGECNWEPEFDYYGSSLAKDFLSELRSLDESITKVVLTVSYVKTTEGDYCIEDDVNDSFEAVESARKIA